MKEKEKLTLGSLFDGSGGFPLAGTLCRITPLWAAEVEPYPVALPTALYVMQGVAAVEGKRIGGN